jgi:aminoglycoside 3-N-acetyltransferase
LLTFRDFIIGFRKLEIDRSRPIIAHASLSAFGEVHGGADTILGALLSSFDTLIMPTFTYKTMVTPELGPPDNAINYGSGVDTNKLAEIFRHAMPADPLMGVVAESLRKHPKAHRTTHPILSFSGINAKRILGSQTIKEPLLCIETIKNKDGWVLLLGVDQTVNTSIHYAEGRAGRKQFVRWALTPKGVVFCPGFPGCSDGFEAVSSHLQDEIRGVEVGQAVIQAMPLVKLVETVDAMIKDNPIALCCERDDCERCNAVRASVSAQ